MSLKLLAQRFLAITLIPAAVFLFPNDQAVEVAAGGIVPRHEPHVLMKKERLVISPGKVSAEYEFENESLRDVITQVAFPVPEYVYPWVSRDKSFADFKLWIDGRPSGYKAEARAFLNGLDRTNVLRKLGITIETFGGFSYETFQSKHGTESFMKYEINKLSPDQQSELIKLGLISGDSAKSEPLIPRWSVRKAYYWTQLFPAGRIVSIRHEYAPVVGYRPILAKDLRNDLKDSCISEELVGKIQLEEARKDQWCGYAGWVKYILTTAKSWKTPIKDFELDVEISPASIFATPKYVSFCWNGKFETIDKGSRSIRVKDFNPDQDLTVFYFW